MKKIKAVILGMITTVLLGVSVSAASFSFTFTNSGTDFSGAATKGSRNFAAVQVTTAPSTATYRYAAAKGIYSNYVTDWKNKKGTGGLDLPYKQTLSAQTSLRLHGATVSASGTTTVKGNWTP